MLSMIFKYCTFLCISFFLSHFLAISSTSKCILHIFFYKIIISSKWFSDKKIMRKCLRRTNEWVYVRPSPASSCMTGMPALMGMPALNTWTCVEAAIIKMLYDGIIEESSSEWCSPIGAGRQAWRLGTCLHRLQRPEWGHASEGALHANPRVHVVHLRPDIWLPPDTGSRE